MHELAVCQGLLGQLERIAAQHGARRVTRIVIRNGPLSGVEPRLLQDAFPLAAAGTLAAESELVVESTPLTVRCDQCGAESEARPNRLICAVCGDWHTRLVSGDELILASVELDIPDPS